jgi:hypothetical protein
VLPLIRGWALAAAVLTGFAIGSGLTKGSGAARLCAGRWLTCGWLAGIRLPSVRPRGLGGSWSPSLSPTGSRSGDGLAGTEAFGSVNNNLRTGGGTAVEDRTLAFSEGDFDGLHLRDLAAFAIIVHRPDKE